jgi:hypothetical protein
MPVGRLISTPAALAARQGMMIVSDKETVP